MQSEAHVVTAAHILGQARGIVKPGLIEMNSECFRRMIDRFKALRAGPEKRAKAIDAIVSDDGCHIRKHDETDAVRMARYSHKRRPTAASEMGRASCRERECECVSISVGAEHIESTKHRTKTKT